MPAKKGMRGWGRIRLLPSKRYQAAYVGPDGLLHKSHTTYQAKLDAEGWLSTERRKIEFGNWSPPGQHQIPALTFGHYAERWYSETKGRHKPRTRDLNRGYLDRVILPQFADAALDAVTVQMVRAWFAGLDAYPTRNANAYSLLRTILNQALDDELIPVNPCRIKRAAVKTRVVEPIALSAGEVRALSAAMKIERWQALVLLAGFSGLRWGELAALRQSDLVLTDDDCSVTVARAVIRRTGEFVIGRPKSHAAMRTVPLPSALKASLETHLDQFALPGRSGLVFPSVTGTVPHENTVRPHLKKAAGTIGHPTLRFHDLRHTAATMFAQAGATLADHMTLMGHTSAAMSARYTHSTASRNRALVENMWSD